MEISLTKRHSIANMTLRYFLFLLGIFTISLGIAFATRSGLGTLPLSSLPYALSIISSLLMLHSVECVREGTILAALFTGTLIRVFTPIISLWFPFLRKNQFHKLKIITGKKQEINSCFFLYLYPPVCYN